MYGDEVVSWQEQTFIIQNYIFAPKSLPLRVKYDMLKIITKTRIFFIFYKNLSIRCCKDERCYSLCRECLPCKKYKKRIFTKGQLIISSTNRAYQSHFSLMLSVVLQIYTLIRRMKQNRVDYFRYFA